MAGLGAASPVSQCNAQLSTHTACLWCSTQSTVVVRLSERKSQDVFSQQKLNILLEKFKGKTSEEETREPFSVQTSVVKNLFILSELLL